MKRFLIVLLAIAGLAVIVLYQQEITTAVLKILGMEEEKKPVIKGIASLSETNKNVTVKRSTETIWNNAIMNEQLAILDSVSTGFDSTATVKFDLGYLMSLKERSLVVIEDPKQEAANLIEVSFGEGALDAKTTTQQPKTTLRIKSYNTVTEVKGEADLSMNVDKVTKMAEIWIRIGEAKVTDDKGTEIIIKQNEKKLISTEALVAEPKVQQPTTEVLKAPELEKVTPKKIKPKKPLKKLTRNDIIRAVARQRKKIDTCYERNRKTASGKSLAVTLTIKNTGVVVGATVLRSNLDDAAVERCVTFWMKALKFPKFDGGPIEETVNFAFQ